MAGLRRSARSEASDVVPQDFDRLEQVVRELTGKHTLLRAETEALRGQLESRETRIGELEGQLSDAHTRRETALERLDSLITELDRLDGQFEAGLEGREWDASADATGLDRAGAASKQAGVRD